VLTGNERYRPPLDRIGLAEAFAIERGDRDLTQRLRQDRNSE
jgi:hypothetical protein